MSELVSLFGDEVEIDEHEALRKHKSLDKESARGICIGACGILGRRASMEDEHIVVDLDDNHTLVAVFDGHGGGDTSSWLHDNFVDRFSSAPQWIEYRTSLNVSLLTSAFENTFMALDRELRASRLDKGSGSCACLCLITPEHFVCANLGDSRCVLGCPGGVNVALSVDHKPELEAEERRVVAAGGEVTFSKGDCYRVNAQIAVSRSIGDFVMKAQDHLSPAEQFVSCIPEVVIQPRSAGDELLVLACDGLWDVLTNDMVLDRAREAYSYGEKSALRVAEELLDYAFEEGSGDNVSVIVAKLPGMLVPVVVETVVPSGEANEAPAIGVDVFRRWRKRCAVAPTQVYYQHTQITHAPFSPFADLEDE
jgi:protein phosphatase PTC2/3